MEPGCGSSFLTRSAGRKRQALGSAVSVRLFYYIIDEWAPPSSLGIEEVVSQPFCQQLVEERERRKGRRARSRRARPPAGRRNRRRRFAPKAPPPLTLAVFPPEERTLPGKMR